MDISPISSKRLYQSIIEQFIDAIKDGKLDIGQKLPPERSLAEMFKVSRASLREAFRVMEIIGLIEVRPGGGSFVTDLNIANFINIISPLFIKNESMESELLEFRKLVEIEAVRLAAEKSSEENIVELERQLKLMSRAIEDDDIDLGAEADINFHKAIFTITGNYILMKTAECVAYILESSVKFNRQKILRNEENSKVLLDQHTALFTAIRRKKSSDAIEIMEKHLDFVKEMM